MTIGSGDALAAGPPMAIPVEVDTPALVVDLDVVLGNLREMASICREAGTELFPHTKTHRTVEFGRLQLENGAGGLTVTTVAEAEAFVSDGAAKVIMAYPLVGEEKIRRVAALARRADVGVAFDSLDAAHAIGRHFSSLGEAIDLYLIVDSGLHRVGVDPLDAAPLAVEISTIPGVRLRGVMTHEGSVYQVESPADLAARSLEAAALMVRTADSIRRTGHRVETVSLGASASARAVAGAPGVTQIRPGIYAFNDLSQVALGLATASTCAARVVTSVISNPAPDRACIDAGSKSLSRDLPPGRGACERFPGYGHLVDLPGWQIAQLSEEHGWLRWVGSGPPTRLTIGQRLQVIPNHVCTVFSSMGESVGLRDGTVVSTWHTIPRGSAH